MASTLTMQDLSSFDLWHAHFGHINANSLRKSHQMVTRFPTTGISKIIFPSCLKGKKHYEAFSNQSSTWAPQPLKLVFMDLCGTMYHVSPSASLYSMIFAHDFNKITWDLFLHENSEALPEFTKWLALVPNESSKTFKTLHVD